MRGAPRRPPLTHHSHSRAAQLPTKCILDALRVLHGSEMLAPFSCKGDLQVLLFQG